MEDINIELKPKKKGFLDKIKGLFEDKSKRALYVVLFILPFLIVIGIFSVVTVKEVKNIINLATGTNEISNDHQIELAGYVLRDNATDYQFEQFIELKEAIENGAADDATIAGMVAKNFVIDFYTWTNKQGQYDIGGMHYVYDGEYTDGTKTKENIFMKARTTFYKYINTYAKQYGQENLLQVENAQVINAQKTDNYIISEHVANRQDENGDWYDYRENHEYEAYNVTVVWNYKNNTKFDSSKYATKMYFVVAKISDSFKIVEASENEIEVKNEIEEIKDVEDIQEEE